MFFYLDSKWHEKQTRRFRNNLLDWSLGGPKKEGWTRAGDIIPLSISPDSLSLSRHTEKMLDVDEILSKNTSEVAAWHQNFLLNMEDASSNLKTTKYYTEYLEPRYDPYECKSRMNTFAFILENMRNNGFDSGKPIYVADLEGVLDLGFRYFRFDGCHRTTVAKHLGIKFVPTFVFSLKECQSG